MKTRSAKRRPRLSLCVQYALAASNLPSRTQVRKWARAALEHDAEITVRIVGQAEARALNRNFRGKDYASNVLTFVFRDTVPYAGDLALCAPIVKRQARSQAKTVTGHYAHLVVHGVLHLQGYDHERVSEARAMEQRETVILAKLGFPDPYA
ncbi:MAG: rRNA maturation RNase YbeY [Betaproteobacteria bacterium]|nr:rRNA maturation RNase YbeY [Betaproteobacteria bacterium]